MSNYAVIPDQSELEIVQQLFVFDGLVTFHLFKNQFGIQDITVLSDFTEADYPSYAPFVYTVVPAEGAFGAGGYAGQQANIGSAVINFPVNTGLSTQTVYGIYATYKDDGGFDRLLMGANVFDTSSSWTNTPVGWDVLTGTAPPTLFGSFTAWDFNQPTPP